MELRSSARWCKHFGRSFVDNCTGNWHLMNFPSQYVYSVVYRIPFPWNTQQKSKWIVENNTNASRKISVAVGNLNHKMLLNGAKNFNLGIWRISWVGIEKQWSLLRWIGTLMTNRSLFCCHPHLNALDRLSFKQYLLSLEQCKNQNMNIVSNSQNLTQHELQNDNTCYWFKFTYMLTEQCFMVNHMIQSYHTLY